MPNPVFVTCKAAAAAALAVLLASAWAVPDLLSAAFVAVLAVSPTLTTALRRGAEQLLLTAAAGVLAVGVATLTLPLAAGVGMAVLAAVGGAFAAGLGRVWSSAAFCVLYMLLVPHPEGTSMAEVRLTALGAGVVSALAVNLVVTVPFYPAVFRRRLHRLHGLLEALCAARAPGAAEVRGLDEASQAVLSELTQAHREARRWPGSTHETLAVLLRHAETLARLALLLRVVHARLGPAALAGLCGQAEPEAPWREDALWHESARLLAEQRHGRGEGR